MEGLATCQRSRLHHGDSVTVIKNDLTSSDYPTESTESSEQLQQLRILRSLHQLNTDIQMLVSMTYDDVICLCI